MLSNEEIIRELYAAAGGHRTDIEKFVSLLSDEGYMRDVSTGIEFSGRDFGDSTAGFVGAFPDAHRELFHIYAAKSVIGAGLAIRGTHKSELALPSGTLAPIGKAIDVPCCDVFHLQSGKVTVIIGHHPDFANRLPDLVTCDAVKPMQRYFSDPIVNDDTAVRNTTLQGG